MKPPRNDPELAADYKKDEANERFLERLNTLLAPHEEEAGDSELEEVYPTLHVIGVPRSGTTLLTQLVATHLSVGCINNLVAAFWAAPSFGIRLSRHLGLVNANSTYRSAFGRTRDISEPHEFGYFWASHLNYVEMAEPEPGTEDSIDWDRLRMTLTRMTHAFERPIVFKSFMLAWYIPQVLAVLPRTCFVRIRRDPLDNAVSLLNTRREYVGSESTWVSLKPREFSWLQHEDIHTQAAGQVLFTDAAITRRIDAANGRNVLECSYQELCRDPPGILARIQALLEDNGGPCAVVGAPPSRFERKKITTEDPEISAIENALESLEHRVLK